MCSVRVVVLMCIVSIISVQVEAGAGLSTDLSQPRPADILVQDWDRGKPAAFDISVDSPLNSNVLSAVRARAGAASEAAELRNWGDCPSLL